MTPEKDVTGKSDKNIDVNSVVIYPNPAKNVFTLSFTLTQSVEFSVEVYDVTGNKVLSLPDQRLQAGTHNQQLDVTVLAPGYYFVKIMAGQNYKIQKLIVE